VQRRRRCLGIDRGARIAQRGARVAHVCITWRSSVALGRSQSAWRKRGRPASPRGAQRAWRRRRPRRRRPAAGSKPRNARSTSPTSAGSPGSTVNSRAHGPRPAAASGVEFQPGGCTRRARSPDCSNLRSRPGCGPAPARRLRGAAAGRGRGADCRASARRSRLLLQQRASSGARRLDLHLVVTRPVHGRRRQRGQQGEHGHGDLCQNSCSCTAPKIARSGVRSGLAGKHVAPFGQCCFWHLTGTVGKMMANA
jgi:hypothetical protein